MATLFPPSVVKAGKIDCRVGFDCAKKEHRARSSESDDSSNERLTPPHVFVESPIKKMLLNELIREHEKELQREEKKSKSSADLVASERTRNLDKNKRMKKLKIFNDDDDETEDEEHLATQRSTSSSDACVVNLSFHHNFSEPIPIPVADLQLRCALRDENVFDTFSPALLSLSFPSFFSIFSWSRALFKFQSGLKVVSKRARRVELFGGCFWISLFFLFFLFLFPHLADLFCFLFLLLEYVRTTHKTFQALVHGKKTQAHRPDERRRDVHVNKVHVKKVPLIFFLLFIINTGTRKRLRRPNRCTIKKVIYIFQSRRRRGRNCNQENAMRTNRRAEIKSATACIIE